MFKKRPLVILFAFVAFIGLLLSNTNLKSNKVQPPAFYCNDPNEFVQTQNCTFCHSGVASYDSTNFILQMGLDTSSLADVISGITTYTPGTQYFMRVKGTLPTANYGFELTANDSNNVGTNVTDFAILNPVNTALLSVTYHFVTHHNADSNNVWTFKWTAPTTYAGIITFYYAGNDGVVGDTDQGDHIYLVSKAIRASGTSGIAPMGDKLSSLSVFPTLFDNDIQISFNLKENAKMEGYIVDLSGRVVKEIINEGLPAGNFGRSFDLRGLSPGVYLVKLQVGDSYTVRKIVKD